MAFGNNTFQPPKIRPTGSLRRMQQIQGQGQSPFAPQGQNQAPTQAFNAAPTQTKPLQPLAPGSLQMRPPGPVSLPPRFYNPSGDASAGGQGFVERAQHAARTAQAAGWEGAGRFGSFQGGSGFVRSEKGQPIAQDPNRVAAPPVGRGFNASGQQGLQNINLALPKTVGVGQSALEDQAVAQDSTPAPQGHDTNQDVGQQSQQSAEQGRQTLDQILGALGWGQAPATGSSSQGLVADTGQGQAAIDQAAAQDHGGNAVTPTQVQQGISNEDRKAAIAKIGNIYTDEKGNMYPSSTQGPDYSHPLGNINDSTSWSPEIGTYLDHQGAGENDQEKIKRYANEASQKGISDVAGYSAVAGVSGHIDSSGEVWSPDGKADLGNINHPDTLVGAAKDAYDKVHPPVNQGQQLLDMLKQMGYGQDPTQDASRKAAFNKSLESDRANVANAQGQAMRAAMEGGARSGVSPEAMLAGQGQTQVQGALAGAQMQSQRQMQYEQQNLQLKMDQSNKAYQAAMAVWQNSNDVEARKVAAQVMAQTQHEQQQFALQMQDLQSRITPGDIGMAALGTIGNVATMGLGGLAKGLFGGGSSGGNSSYYGMGNNGSPILY